MVALIEQFSNLHAGCPVIVTSRFVGYRDAPVSDEFSIYHLSNSNGVEVEKFAQKFIKAIAGLKVEKSEQKGEKFSPGRRII